MFVLACVCTEVLRPTSQRPQRTVFFSPSYKPVDVILGSKNMTIKRTYSRTNPSTMPYHAYRVRCSHRNDKEKTEAQPIAAILAHLSRRACRRDDDADEFLFILFSYPEHPDSVLLARKAYQSRVLVWMCVCVCVCVSAVEYWLKINA